MNPIITYEQEEAVKSACTLCNFKLMTYHQIIKGSTFCINFVVEHKRTGEYFYFEMNKNEEISVSSVEQLLKHMKKG